MLGLNIGQFGEDIGRIVRVHLFEQIGGFFERQRLNIVSRLLRMEFRQEVRAPFIRNRFEEFRDLFRGEIGREIDEFRRSDVGHDGADAIGIPGGQQCPHLFFELLQRIHGQSLPRFAWPCPSKPPE